jgi:hypothetical protein
VDYTSKAVLTEKEASQLFQISASFLQKKRIYGGGPSYYKVGVRVYYKREELEQWLTGTKHCSTAEYDTTYKKRARAQA